MTRTVLAVDLKDDPDTIAAYRAHHRRVWPEVLDSLRGAGIHSMDIYLLGRRLVMVVETEGDVRRAFARHVTSHPRVAEWESLMRSMQEPVPEGTDGDWWTRMEPVFQLAASVEPAAPAEGVPRR